MRRDDHSVLAYPPYTPPPERIMRRLSHRQIFLDVLRLYFAPLVGAIRGAFREVAVVQRSIERRKRLGG
jgi:hypothetical protein